jgi:hypothetical protein
MTVLMWDKPAKTESTEEWKSRSADGAPPGVYTPNMGEADMLAWKARLVGGQDPRVEIRKTVVGTPRKSKHGSWNTTSYAQVLIVVRADSVTMSANGTMEFSNDETSELFKAVAEARAALGEGRLL